MDTIKFCTGSEYTGPLGTIKPEMQGFGTYTYPDGSVYSGEFVHGRFNGNGQLRLSAPYNMTFNGIFVDDRLVNIHQISFNDDLRFYDYDGNDGERIENVMENWIYCNSDDRRYLREHFHGLNPTTDNAHVTADMEKRRRLLQRGYYDTEEGIYWPVSGFLYNIQSPLPAIRFVETGKEAEEIRQHCRYGGSSYDNCKIADIGVPLHPICPEIIKNNLLTMEDIDRNDNKLFKNYCACTLKDHHCENLLRPPFDDASSADRAECFLTRSNSSFGMDSLNLPLKRKRISRKDKPSVSTEKAAATESEHLKQLKKQVRINQSTEQEATKIVTKNFTVTDTNN